MSEETLTAYCMKCKATRPIKDGQAIYMGNGRPATRGVCPVCGTGLNKIGATPRTLACESRRPAKAVRKRRKGNAEASPLAP